MQNKTKYLSYIAILVLSLLVIFYVTRDSLPGAIPEGMTTEQKKARFIKLILPAIQKVYGDLNKKYSEISAIAAQTTLSKRDTEKLVRLQVQYGVKTNLQLLKILKPHPKSIALAQAALESAWATSRFFQQANNVFGMWSFDEDEPRIPAGKKRGDKIIWVRKYSSIENSVSAYYAVLAHGGVYARFRTAKMNTSDPFELVKYLDKYSERGSEYGKELGAMIRFNKFDQYD